MLSREDKNRAFVHRLYTLSSRADLVIEGTVVSNPHFTVDDVIAEGDKVAVRFTLSGTHRQESHRLPPNGAEIKATGIAIYRIVDGKIAEHWVNLDRLRLLQQVRVLRRVEQAVA